MELTYHEYTGVVLALAADTWAGLVLAALLAVAFHWPMDDLNFGTAMIFHGQGRGWSRVAYLGVHVICGLAIVPLAILNWWVAVGAAAGMLWDIDWAITAVYPKWGGRMHHEWMWPAWLRKDEARIPKVIGIVVFAVLALPWV